MLDLLSNFKKSAQENAPLYLIQGGPGLTYAATYDRLGRGTLRITAVNFPSVPQQSDSAGAMARAPAPQVASPSRSVTGIQELPDNQKSTQHNNKVGQSNTSAQGAPRERIALVIGNGNYAHMPKLPNPKNDARDMTRVLRSMGFTVYFGPDLKKRDMSDLVRQFSAQV